MPIDSNKKNKFVLKKKVNEASYDVDVCQMLYCKNVLDLHFALVGNKFGTIPARFGKNYRVN